MAVSGVKEFEIKADPATVMQAVDAVDRLPEWSSAHKKITIESTHDDGRPHRVRMAVSILGINDEQVVDYTFEGDEKVTWTLVESGQQNQQDGSYVLTPTDSGTKVTFELTIDPKIPLPGFLVKKAQKTALETASKGLTKFVENF
ncbi:MULTISPECIES: SRPBCC family protein [unclassified Rhodococcus (in: high G+C Gram-positive bacteria)]|uniref:SRPBCC family protein n=1 Tax=unclassified Rhodococcus (in: high G+C Gram-positive bacteria) TaxID=192944 RepID=UPI0024B6608F|nr:MULTISPECIES: SRPBCC family protein [unclassified Rhodococcus (in: high G+C Gram-positive bacteria)]MDI9956346.1 SRPBCC family protein [Rhodococcus sp. IEGM 1237]MDI9965184.1 SRPBCC family protein [Rhodococcus sp. IEGM 1251]MDV8124599.1 SRPBCC family protein [Rhodococcus sp. IEGM 1304]